MVQLGMRTQRKRRRKHQVPSGVFSHPLLSIPAGWTPGGWKAEGRTEGVRSPAQGKGLPDSRPLLLPPAAAGCIVRKEVVGTFQPRGADGGAQRSHESLLNDVIPWLLIIHSLCVVLFTVYMYEPIHDTRILQLLLLLHWSRGSGACGPGLKKMLSWPWRQGLLSMHSWKQICWSFILICRKT